MRILSFRTGRGGGCDVTLRWRKNPRIPLNPRLLRESLKPVSHYSLEIEIRENWRLEFGQSERNVLKLKLSDWSNFNSPLRSVTRGLKPHYALRARIEFGIANCGSLTSQSNWSSRRSKLLYSILGISIFFIYLKFFHLYRFLLVTSIIHKFKEFLKQKIIYSKSIFELKY